MYSDICHPHFFTQQPVSFMRLRRTFQQKLSQFFDFTVVIGVTAAEAMCVNTAAALTNHSR